MLTIQRLYNMYAGEDTGTLTPAILMDLFGMMNWPDEIRKNREEFDKRTQLMDGLFKGLYLMDVSVNEIEQSRKKNKLDRLIHSKYKQRSSGYYKQFCDQNITIGPTQML